MGERTEIKLKPPSDETMEALMDLAGLAAMLVGGPYAHGAISILKVLDTFRKDYKISPEFEKYFEAKKRLTEAYNRRHGIEGGET